MTEYGAAYGKGLYHGVYLSRVASALSACRTVAQLSHAGEKGRIREILLRSLFRPLLPSDLGVGTGFILSSAGQVSPQQDIVLYDRASLPPALFDDDTGLFPIESVLFTIEVKSVLDRGELAQSHANARTLAGFQLLGTDGKPAKTGPRPGTSIFALASDLQEGGKKEHERYNEVRGSDPAFLTSICVAGRGYWWLQDAAFRSWPERYAHAEVLGYLTGIMNAIPAQYELRRSARPPLGAYLSDFGAVFEKLIDAIAKLQVAVREKAAREADAQDIGPLQERAVKLQQSIEAVFGQYDRDELADLRLQLHGFHASTLLELATLENRRRPRSTPEAQIMQESPQNQSK